MGHHLLLSTLRLNVESLRIVPVTPALEAAARDVVVSGLTEHFGTYRSDANPDLADLASAYPGESFFVGTCAGTVIATGALVPESRGIVRVVRMSVARAARREGIGSAMLRHLLTVAHSRGYGEAVLETTSTWREAIDFYLAQGFEIEGESGGDTCFRKLL